MEVRRRIYTLFADAGFPVTTPRPDIGAGDVALACNLLDSWSRWAGDPGVKVTPLLWDGAPVGVARDFDLDGILLSGRARGYDFS